MSLTVENKKFIPDMTNLSSVVSQQFSQQICRSVSSFIVEVRLLAYSKLNDFNIRLLYTANILSNSSTHLLLAFTGFYVEHLTSRF